MRSKALALTGIIIIISVLAIVTPSARNKPAVTQGEGIQLPININQLQSDGAEIPVKLRCRNAELSAPNDIKRVPCVIVNNTNKRISAAAMTFTVIYERDGKTASDTSVLTIETFVHADLRRERPNNLIPSRGGESPAEPLPVQYDDVVIKGITMSVDYVEFEDQTTLGPNRSGSRIIADIRSGAAKYQKHLVEKYKRSGDSIQQIILVLEEQPLPDEELGIQNGYEEQGANIYRTYTRDIYKTKGADGLIKYLKSTGTPANR